MKPTTTVTITRKTQDRLNTFGKFHESYDGLLNRLMDNMDKLQQMMSNEQ